MAQSQVEYFLRISSQQAGLMDDGPTYHELCRRWGRSLPLWDLQGSGGALIPMWLLEEVSLLQLSPAEPPWPASGVETHSLRWFRRFRSPAFCHGLLHDLRLSRPASCPLRPRHLPSGGAPKRLLGERAMAFGL